MAITDKLTNLAEAIRNITKIKTLLTIDEMTNAVNSVNRSGIDDLILTKTSLVLPPGVYQNSILIYLKGWEWDSLDFQNGLITEASEVELKEGG